VILFRPVGVAELRRIAESGFLKFPPRLPGQPIFYPVLDREYAQRIARDWNTNDAASGFAGFVARFEVDDDFARRYPVQVVGDASCRELWIPAEDLGELNRRIRGRIEVLEAFPGPGFPGRIDPRTGLPEGLEGPAVGEETNSYLPPPGIRPDEETVRREIRHLSDLLEEARFETGWHAFGDEDSYDCSLGWRDRIEEAIDAWRALLGRG
jgi:hypothetical protein